MESGPPHWLWLQNWLRRNQETLSRCAHSAHGTSPEHQEEEVPQEVSTCQTAEWEFSLYPLPSPFSLWASFSPPLEANSPQLWGCIPSAPQWVLRYWAVPEAVPAPLPAMMFHPSPKVGPTSAGGKEEALRKLEKVCNICVQGRWFTQRNFNLS